MKERMMRKSELHEIFTIAEMKLEPMGNDAYKAARTAAETSRRFLKAAEALRPGEALGWQLAAAPGGGWSVSVFSSAAAAVSSEDIHWIFRGCAEVLSMRQGALRGAGEENRSVYALARRERNPGEDGGKEGRGYGRGFGYDPFEDEAFSAGQYADALDTLNRAGAVLQIVADGGGEGQGALLLSLPAAMSLRLRAALSLAFADTAAVELTGRDELEPLPASCLMAGMAGLLQTLLSAGASGRHGESDRDAGEEGGASESGPAKAGPSPEEGGAGTPIEELELSVRAFNCLKRAGIDTVEKLRTLTDDDYPRIRNLGRRCAEEIKQKLLGTAGLPSRTPLTASSYSAMLEELVGLRNVKEQVRKIAAFARMKRDMAARGVDQTMLSLNMEFVGNPGTAKTTVARILAGLFGEMGLLPGGELVEVGRADLVARYEGQTADKVKTVFRKARGKLLFIDEAYSLVENQEGEFGDEAISTIVQEMENNRGDTVVVFAGYPDRMEPFFSRNAGLRSRVPFRVFFSDYSAEEMLQIAELEAKKRGFSIGENAKEAVVSLCAEASRNPNMGNGRFCRNLVENAVLNYAARVYGSAEDGAAGDFVLTAADFDPPPLLSEQKKTPPIGFRI